MFVYDIRDIVGIICLMASVVIFLALVIIGKIVTAIDEHRQKKIAGAYKEEGKDG